MATETVRFSRVLEESGQPETYTLWVKPGQDKAFAALLRQDRVMTVHQETGGGKADYGLVGYTQDRHRSLLVFPKSLKAFKGKRIIGIKYDELKGASSAGTEAVTPRKQATPPRTALPRKSFPAPKLHQSAPAPKGKKAGVALPPPPPENQIPFPKPEVVRVDEPEPDLGVGLAEDLVEKVAEDPAKEAAHLRMVMRKALAALTKDKPVTALNLLQEALKH